VVINFARQIENILWNLFEKNSRAPKNLVGPDHTTASARHCLHVLVAHVGYFEETTNRQTAGDRSV